MTIRECELSDIESVHSLIQNELGYCDITESGLLERLEKLIAAEEHTVLVAEIDGEVCGLASFIRELSLEVNGEYLRVLCLAVRADMQGKGIGSALIKRIEELAAEQGASLITLSSNFKRPAAHEFYEKNGFHKTSFTFKKLVMHTKKRHRD